MARNLTYRNRRLALISFTVAAGMVGASFAAVPLYEVFCQVTGYGGTTQVAEAAPGEVLDRKMTVRFNADVGKEMPWRFVPAQDRVDIKVGEQALAFYRAKNISGRTMTGTATFNVTPAQGRPVLQQGRMLLLYRAGTQSGRRNRYAGDVLYRSGYRERS